MESVLNTSELLEFVLEAVEPQTLLTSATRVCHYWNGLIRDSIRLQRTLFLLPERQSTCSQPRSNPLLLPHIKTLSRGQPNAINFQNLLSCECDTPNKFDKFLRTEASWRNMLVQQPPATKLGVWKIESVPGDYRHIFEDIDLSRTSGLCMGHLLDLIKQWDEEGWTWTLFWGEHGQNMLDRERNSLLVLKVGTSVQTSLMKMRGTSQIAVKLCRWSET